MYCTRSLGKHLTEEFILKSCYILKYSCPAPLRQLGIQNRAHSSVSQVILPYHSNISPTRDSMICLLPRFLAVASTITTHWPESRQVLHQPRFGEVGSSTEPCGSCQQAHQTAVQSPLDRCCLPRPCAVGRPLARSGKSLHSPGIGIEMSGTTNNPYPFTFGHRM